MSQTTLHTIKSMKILGPIVLALLVSFQIELAHAQQAPETLQLAPSFIVERYEQQAASGDPRAMFRLAVLAEQGLITGTPQLELACDWFTQAAQSGHPTAQFKTGMFLMKGQCSPKDLPKAAFFFLEAAKQGVAEAQFNYALLADQGLGIDPNRSDAIRWYEQAAFRGVSAAYRALGLLYLGGSEDRPTDNVEAWAWLKQASDIGDMEAQAELDRLTPLLSDRERQEANQLFQAYQALRLTN